MISIIVCSRHSAIDDCLKHNIDITIGNIPYEIIWIDNSNNNYSIFTAYNKGVEKAQYAYLCFMHEDILFHTQGWGGVIINKLQNPQIALLGIMGTHYMDQYCEYYDTSRITRGRILQSNYHNGNLTKTLYKNYEYKDLGCNVVAIDGVWMATKKKLFNDNILQWDDKTYKGYHFYDMDLSMQAISNNLIIQIVDELLIEHKSMGNFNEDFYNASILFHQKWNTYFPIMSTNIPYEILNKTFLKQLLIKKDMHKAMQWYQKTLNKAPYKILTKILLMLRVKLY